MKLVKAATALKSMFRRTKVRRQTQQALSIFHGLLNVCNRSANQRKSFRGPMPYQVVSGPKIEAFVQEQTEDPIK